jgi:hypothetical protein
VRYSGSWTAPVLTLGAGGPVHWVGRGGGRVDVAVRYTVRKMDLILRSIERMLKMQFSMARNFTLQPLRSLPKKRHKRNLTFDAPCLQKNS